MEREAANGADSSSRSSSDVDGELEALERRKAELQKQKQQLEKREQGPADREEAFVTGIVELVLGATQHKPIPELRRRAAKILDAFRSSGD